MTRQDREDFLSDGRSPERRQNLLAGEAAVREWQRQHPWSLAAYLVFLCSIQTAWGDFTVDKQPWTGTDFRL